MTTEEKAKAYDEALRYAMIYYKEGNEDMKMMMKTCFPALVEESEDERIRKGLIGILSKYKHVYSKEIAWLEKQGEQKPTWSEEDERLCQCIIKDQEKALDEVRNDKYGHSEIISDLKEMYRERIDWLKSIKDRIQSKV